MPDFFQHGACGFQHTYFPNDVQFLPVVSSKHQVENYQFPACDTKNLGLYPVLDTVEQLQFCLEQGVKTVQLRIKDLQGQALEQAVERACQLGEQYQARLFINDYWALAIKYQAYGVHLGQDDIKTADLACIAQAGLHLGISTHSWYEIALAHSIQPSYIAIGPIYATATKVMPFAPQGLQQLQQWQKMLHNRYPLVAIGGIDLSNAAHVLATGVGSIAVVRAITQAEDKIQAIAQLQALVEEKN